MGIVNAYFPIERLRHFLTTHKMYGFQYLLASLFGAVTPFCSCSSIPLFIGFVNGGIPLGVTFAFLITSPLVNEVAVAMFLGTFGLKITLIYVLSGVVLGVVGGFVLAVRAAEVERVGLLLCDAEDGFGLLVAKVFPAGLLNLGVSVLQPEHVACYLFVKCWAICPARARLVRHKKTMGKGRKFKVRRAKTPRNQRKSMLFGKKDLKSLWG